MSLSKVIEAISLLRLRFCLWIGYVHYLPYTCILTVQYSHHYSMFLCPTTILCFCVRLTTSTLTTHTHSQGICSSAQGLVNAILFCALTKVVRQKLILCLCCRLRQDKFTKVYPLQATPPDSGGVLEDSTDSERGESPDNSPRKQLLAGSSDSVPKYHSINQGVSFTTE